MKRILLYLLLPAALLPAQSCHTSHAAAYAYDSPSSGYEYSASDKNTSSVESDLFYKTEAGNASIPGRSTGETPKRPQEQKKIIYHARMNMTVKQVDTVSKKIEAIATGYNGYTTESGTDRMVIRVEAAYLDSAVAAIGKLGRVDKRSVSGQDVTGEYFDLQIRMENAEKARARYLELLAKAENVQAALLVEKELERLNNEIDLVKGRMNTITTLSTYSTITVNLKEKTKLGPLGLISVGLYRGVKWLFVRG